MHPVCIPCKIGHCPAVEPMHFLHNNGTCAAVLPGARRNPGPQALWWQVRHPLLLPTLRDGRLVQRSQGRLDAAQGGAGQAASECAVNVMSSTRVSPGCFSIDLVAEPHLGAPSLQSRQASMEAPTRLSQAGHFGIIKRSLSRDLSFNAPCWRARIQKWGVVESWHCTPRSSPPDSDPIRAAA